MNPSTIDLADSLHMVPDMFTYYVSKSKLINDQICQMSLIKWPEASSRRVTCTINIVP